MPFTVDLNLSTPSCGAQEQLTDKQRLRCLGLGGMFGAYGFVDGPASDRITPLAGDPSGLAEVPQADCQRCPLRFLPSGMRPLGVEVRTDGVRLQLLVEDDSDITAALRALRDAGQGPRRVGTHTKRGSVIATIPWGALTARQRETLEVAAGTGYFAPGGAGVGVLAAALGVSRSTAHEHLQKALNKLLAAMFEA